MWWRSAALALALLAGCGFTPVYGPGGAGSALRGQIALRAPATLDEAVLAEALRERLGGEGAARRLDYTLKIEAMPQALSGDGARLRTQLLGNVSFGLDGGPKASVSAMTSFASGGSPVEARAADQAARERLAAMLADRMVARLIADTARGGA